MADCNNLWDPKSQLYAQPFLQKGLSADTSAAYGLMAFVGDNPRLKLVLTGTFPKGSYMSLQIYRGSFQSSKEVGDVLSDYEIAANLGGKNPFQTLNRNDTGKFQIAITPDPAAKGGALKNTIWYNANPGPFESRLISAFYRVYQPAGGQLSKDDLPKIESCDFATNVDLPCPPVQRLDWYLDLPYDLIALLNNSALLKTRTLTFDVKQESAGTNKDAMYAFTYANIPRGDVAIVRFEAPKIDFGSQKADAPVVRYWSICSIYWPMLRAMNGVACDWDHPDKRDVTVVFGPNKASVKEKAKLLGAHFLSDDREKDEDVMGFIVRNVLPSEKFQQQMFKGPFLPRGRVYTEQEFQARPKDKLLGLA